MPPNAGIIPRVGQAGMQAAAIGETCAARHIALSLKQDARFIARDQFVETGHTRQTAADYNGQITHILRGKIAVNGLIETEYCAPSLDK